MRIGHFQFRPNLVPTLVTLILLPMLISLGFWQLSRAEEKRAILAEQLEKSRLPALHITAANKKLEEIKYRQLVVSGKYLSKYQILVDNKVHQGEVGFYVVTPFRIEGTDSVVLVNRGWVKGTGSREILPSIVTPETNLSIKGIAKFKTKDIVTFNDQNRLGQDWPALVRWVDIKELDKDIPYKLKPYLILQAAAPDQDYVRNWKLVNSTPDKNLSYAAQWFTLAGVLLLIFIGVNTKRIPKQD